MDTPKVDPQPAQLELFPSNLEKNGTYSLKDLGFIKIAEHKEDHAEKKKPSLDKVIAAWNKLKKERPDLVKKWKSTKEKENYIRTKVHDDEQVSTQTN